MVVVAGVEPARILRDDPRNFVVALFEGSLETALITIS